jgi:hypothetical protein
MLRAAHPLTPESLRYVIGGTCGHCGADENGSSTGHAAELTLFIGFNVAMLFQLAVH